MEAQEAKDIGDSLRLEVGSKPRVETIIKATVNKYADRIDSDFGKFIPGETKRHARIAAYNTIVVADDVRFIDAVGLWTGKQDADGAESMDGLYDILGGLDGKNLTGWHTDTTERDLPVSLIKSPNQVWDDLGKEKQESMTAVLKEKGWTMSAENFIVCVHAFGISAHELAHSYIRQANLPAHIDEFFASELGDYVFRKENPGLPPRNKDADKLYQEMVAKYGDDFYKTMFGTIQDSTIRSRILNDLSEEKIREVLPESVEMAKAISLKDLDLPELSHGSISEKANYLPDIRVLGMSNEEMEKIADSTRQINLGGLLPNGEKLIRQINLGGGVREGLKKGTPVASSECPQTLRPRTYNLPSISGRPTFKQLQERALELEDKGSIEAMLQLAIKIFKGNIEFIEDGGYLIGPTSTFIDSRGYQRVLTIHRFNDQLWLNAPYTDNASINQIPAPFRLVVFPASN